MAQKVNVELIDDTDGSPAAETVNFALDGTAYEIDLSEPNSGQLRGSLAVYIEHARKLSATASRKRPTGLSTGLIPRRQGSEAAEMRAWLITNGYDNDVKEKGRVPEWLQERYERKIPKATVAAAPSTDNLTTRIEEVINGAEQETKVASVLFAAPDATPEADDAAPDPTTTKRQRKPPVAKTTAKAGAKADA